MREFLKKSRLTIAVFVVLTVSTVFSYIDLTETPTATEQRTAFSDAMKVSQSIELERKPAAIENKKNTVVETQVFCDKAPRARFITVVQPLVMLDLVSCETIKSQRHIWVKNHTNGFKAQIFSLKSNKYRTDFIQLNQGTNRIEIESVLKDGQKRVQSLEIVHGS